MCYVLLVIQQLRMNGIFLSIVDFPVGHCVYPCSSLSAPLCYSCRLPVYQRIFFLSVVDFSCHSLLGMCASIQYIQSS